MRFREVFRYELAYRLHSRTTWVFAVILFCIAFSFNLDDGPRNAVAHANAPSLIAVFMLIISLFGMPISAAFFGDAAIRDVQANMDPLLFTSPLRKIDYLGGRFLAAFTSNAIVLLAVPLGLAVPVLMGPLNLAVGPFHLATFGPFRIGAYLQPYLLVTLPNMAFAGALLFTAGMLTRKIIPVYLAAIGLVIGNMVLGVATEDSVNPMAWLLSPLGFHAVESLSEYWTPAERNTRLIGFPANLVWNRVVWLSVTAGVLALLHHAFRFAHPDGGFGRQARQGVIEPESKRIGPVAVPRIAGTFAFRTTVHQTLAVAQQSLAEFAASRWFAVVLIACTGLTLLWGHNVGETVFDTSTWPITMLVVETVLSERVVPLIYLLIALYAGELVWKEREVGTAEIADAAPVPEGVTLLGRFLTLVALIVLFQAACMVGGILIQALQGYYRFELGLYLRVVFGLKLADYVLLAVLAMTIHVLVNHKYLGHMIVVLAIVFTRVFERLDIGHHLLVYGTDPGWTYSDMNGFGPFVAPYVWFKLYWAVWALLLAVVAVLFWVRGRENGLPGRLRDARARITGPVLRTAGVAIALILVLGGFIFYNTNVLNEYQTADEQGAPQAAYEKRYKRYQDIPQPTLDGVQLRVEIYPGQPAVELRGSYRLINLTNAAVDSVHVYLVPGIEARSLSFDRAARPVVVDEETGYRIFALTQPLEPGDSLRLVFDVAFRPRGFRNSEIQTDVVGNGAYFNRSWLPFIGYQPRFELPGSETRQRFGLAPRPPLPPPDDAAALRYRSSERNEDRAHVDAIIGTAADQIAVTPGVLRRSWMENGRRYFHYQTEVLTAFGGTVFSGEYALLEDRWNEVALQIFHHPAHTWNLDRMVRGMKSSLDYFTTQFGTYPDRQLRIVEIPRYGGFGHAHPHTIAFTEDAFLSRVKPGEVDQPFYGTAHEVAHQWWGAQLQGAPVRGHRFLTESLANYSAMMVTEKTYGPEVARRVYDFHMDLYFRGRATQSREVPLLQVTDQGYIAYRRGAIAMYTLRELIGEDRVNTALRRYLEKFRDAGPPYPTSLDLYAELRAVTPDSLHALLEDLFETVTLWDVETEQAVVEPTGTGEYNVTLDVVARKTRADSIGNETEVPMNDLVEIGVFAPGAGNSLGEALYLKRHRIRSGKQTIRITVPREPARAGIDPYHKLIDRQSNDNLRQVNARDR